MISDSRSAFRLSTSGKLQMVQRKRAVIYCRVSTADQNCERQLSDLQQFAQQAGYDIIGQFTETASGAKNDRQQRNKVLELAQARKIDVVLVSELTRWGRNTLDLLHTLEKLADYNVSIIAQTGLQFNLSTAEGKLIAGFMSSLAEFERSLLRQRIMSGMDAAKTNGKKLGRQKGHNPSDKYKDKVLSYLSEGRSVRWIAHDLQISKTTVNAIVKRYSKYLVAA